MRKNLITYSAICFLLVTTSCTSAERNATTVGKDIAVEKLQKIAAIGYDNVDFTVSRLQFIKEFRGAMKVANEDEAIGVTHYAIQGIGNDYDVVGFMFLDDQLMSLTFTYQEDRIRQLGGVSELKTKARKRFGTPTDEKESKDIWVFPTVDREVVGVSHDEMWTLAIHRTSLSKTLETVKLKMANAQSVQPDHNPEVEKPKEGWVYWQPTATELAEMEAEAKESVRRSRKPRLSLPTTTRFASETRRHRELGKKKYPTHAEIREYLILDGRLGVRAGQWTAEEFEAFTGEKH